MAIIIGETIPLNRALPGSHQLPAPVIGEEVQMGYAKALITDEMLKFLAVTVTSNTIDIARQDGTGLQVTQITDHDARTGEIFESVSLFDDPVDKLEVRRCGEIPGRWEIRQDIPESKAWVLEILLDTIATHLPRVQEIRT